MAFGWFRKLVGPRRGPHDARFDSDADDPLFDEMDSTGEFIDEDRGAPPRMPEPGPTPRPRAPIARAPAPAPIAPRPTGPGPATAPRPAPVVQPAPVARPRTPPPDDDITGLYDPRTMGPRVSTGGAAPLPPPPVSAESAAPVAHPVRPMARTPGPVRSSAPLPPPPAAMDSDKTILMPGPTGNTCVVAWLVVAKGADFGKDYRLPNGTVRIGIDAGCDVRLQGDSYISGYHAEICYRQGQFELRDLGSTNGTLVNGVRIGDAVLRDNDRLSLGETHLVFKSLSL